MYLSGLVCLVFGPGYLWLAKCHSGNSNGKKVEHEDGEEEDSFKKGSLNCFGWSLVMLFTVHQFVQVCYV